MPLLLLLLLLLLLVLGPVGMITALRIIHSGVLLDPQVRVTIFRRGRAIPTSGSSNNNNNNNSIGVRTSNRAHRIREAPSRVGGTHKAAAGPRGLRRWAAGVRQ